MQNVRKIVAKHTHMGTRHSVIILTISARKLAIISLNKKTVHVKSCHRSLNEPLLLKTNKQISGINVTLIIIAARWSKVIFHTRHIYVCCRDFSMYSQLTCMLNLVRACT